MTLAILTAFIIRLLSPVVGASRRIE